MQTLWILRSLSLKHTAQTDTNNPSLNPFWEPAFLQKDREQLKRQSQGACKQSELAARAAVVLAGESALPPTASTTSPLIS